MANEEKSSKHIQSEIAAAHQRERSQQRLERQFQGVNSDKELREGEHQKAELEAELREAERRDSTAPDKGAA